ncbi:hypothetical protein BBP40_000440 [Aspergillus hancockii]|nr:hypothetical protein BBP40_000440 [Aspergillus hancockii]
MKSILMKPLALLSTLSLGAVATPIVSYAGYYNGNCASPSVTATNIAASYCANVENIPIKSFTAYVFSGACDDGKSPVLNAYTEANCESGLFGSRSVSSEKQCFEADTTIVSIGIELLDDNDYLSQVKSAKAIRATIKIITPGSIFRDIADHAS